MNARKVVAFSARFLCKRLRNRLSEPRCQRQQKGNFCLFLETVHEFCLVCVAAALLYLSGDVASCGKTSRKDSYSDNKWHNTITWCDLIAVPRDISLGVRSVVLEHNQITSLSPGDFLLLEYCISLDLSNNLIFIIVPGSFDGRKSLHTVKLAKNRLTELKPDTFKGLKRLTFLDLCGNQLAVLDETIFSGLQSLVRSNICENQLSSLDEYVFYGLFQLGILNLELNNFFWRKQEPSGIVIPCAGWRLRKHSKQFSGPMRALFVSLSLSTLQTAQIGAHWAAQAGVSVSLAGFNGKSKGMRFLHSIPVLLLQTTRGLFQCSDQRLWYLFHRSLPWAWGENSCLQVWRCCSILCWWPGCVLMPTGVLWRRHYMAWTQWKMDTGPKVCECQQNSPLGCEAKTR